MGADLYIPSLFNPQSEAWEPKFRKAVQARDQLKKDTPEYEAAQKRVEETYDQMYDRGYFRDSYNDWDVLWKFGLSWWNDITPLLDKEGLLPVPMIREVLKMLDQRQPDFDATMAGLPAKDREYFENKALVLRSFLEQAVNLQEPILCSL